LVKGKGWVYWPNLISGNKGNHGYNREKMFIAEGKRCGGDPYGNCTEAVSQEKR